LWKYSLRTCGEGGGVVSAAALITALISGAAPRASPHLHEVVDGFQVRQVVVGDVDADAEVKPGVAAVNDLEVAELGGGT